MNNSFYFILFLTLTNILLVLFVYFNSQIEQAKLNSAVSQAFEEYLELEGYADLPE